MPKFRMKQEIVINRIRINRPRRRMAMTLVCKSGSRQIWQRTTNTWSANVCMTGSTATTWSGWECANDHSKVAEARRTSTHPFPANDVAGDKRETFRTKPCNSPRQKWRWPFRDYTRWARRVRARAAAARTALCESRRQIPIRTWISPLAMMPSASNEAALSLKSAPARHILVKSDTNDFRSSLSIVWAYDQWLM